MASTPESVRISACVAEASKINQSLDIGGFRRGRSISGCLDVQLLKAATLAKAMDKIINHIHIAHRVGEGVGIQNVALHHFHLTSPGPTLKA